MSRTKGAESSASRRFTLNQGNSMKGLLKEVKRKGRIILALGCGVFMAALGCAEEETSENAGAGESSDVQQEPGAVVELRYRGEELSIGLEDLELDIIRYTEVVSFETILEQIEGLTVEDVEFSILIEDGGYLDGTHKRYPVAGENAHYGGVNPVDMSCYWEKNDDEETPDVIGGKGLHEIAVVDMIEATRGEESKKQPLRGIVKMPVDGISSPRELVKLESIWKRTDLGGLKAKDAVFEYTDHEGRSPADDPACAAHYPVPVERASMGWMDPATHDLRWVFGDGDAPECLDLAGISKIRLITP